MFKINRVYFSYLNLMIILILLFGFKAFAQQKLYFGVDADVNEVNDQEIINDSSANYKQFFNDYYIKFIRFPGGEPARYFFWNNTKLSQIGFEYLNKYKVWRGAEKKNLKKRSIPDSIYLNFLKFCKRNGITPIIQLNTMYYTFNGSVYQVDVFQKNYSYPDLQKNREEIVKSGILKQIKFTHTILDTVYWEIGNEDYVIYDPDVYLNIVNMYSKIIRANYPDDKIIVEMANSYWKKGSKARWNKKFVNLIFNTNKENEIDYFAPHFYTPFRSEIKKKNFAIMDEIKTSAKPEEFEKHDISFFPENYSPKFFYTEFGLLNPQKSNPNFSTQFHALLMFEYLFNVYKSKNVYGVIHHEFLGNPSPLFYSKRIAEKLGIRIEKSNGINKIFYIPPQAEAVKIFLMDVGKKYLNYYNYDSLDVIISSNDNHTLIQILNSSYDKQELDLNNIREFSNSTKSNLKEILFDNLESRIWDITADTKNLKIKNSGRLEIPGLSYLVIKN